MKTLREVWSRSRDLVRRGQSGSQRGSIIVVVLIIVLSFAALASVLLFQGQAEYTVAVNEQDHLKALGFAEAGLTWAEQRVMSTSDFNGLLDGLDPNTTADDHLLGLRDLSLTNTSQLNSTNEGTKSAIVTRDFGDGAKKWEVIRVPDTARTRANVHVRIEDNWDDDPGDPNNNNPVVDTDSVIKAVAVAEYPIFVDGFGVEVANGNDDRGRALTRLEASYKSPRMTAAIATDGSLSVPGDMEICGACGSAHANGNLSTSGNPDICVDYTASGTYSGGGATVGGNSGGGYPVYPIPVINPFDDVFVPDPNTFDTSGNMSLPAELRCPRASAGDPGANKYFALVGNTSNKGYVFKAYWDFGNDRWLWKKIDDIDVGADIEVDNCGRAPGDANYGSAVSDGGGDEFYGFKGTGTEETQSCNSCASAGKDKSLCDIANNDFADNAYYIYPGGASQATIASTGLKALPGSFVPDTTADFVPTSSIKDGGTKWDYSTDFVYSPMYNAVVFVYGNVYVGGNPGNSSSGIYCKDSGCTGAGGVPLDTWQVSLISVGSIRISGNPSMSPANTAAGFWHLYIAGRDVYVSGNPGATQACASGCSTTSPSNVDTYAGIIAAHEQIQISGNPQILGFMLAENAIDCSAEVDGMGGGFSTVNGNPQIYYDCNNPPNPWAQQAEVQYWSYRDR